MPYLSAAANAWSWVAAALVVIALIGAYLRNRYVKSTCASFATQIEEVKTGAAAKPLPYQDAVRRANGAALRWLGGLLVGIPVVLVAVYLLVSGLYVADRTLMIALAALAGATAVLIGVFIAIREIILAGISYTEGK